MSRHQTALSAEATKETVRSHQPGQDVFKAILSEDIDWKPFAAFPPSVRLAVVVGQPSEKGPYTIRVKVPHDAKLMPHKHTEDRVYTVISGIFYIGLGDQFDADKSTVHSLQSGCGGCSLGLGDKGMPVADSLLVKVTTDQGLEGWGESFGFRAVPLTKLAPRARRNYGGRPRSHSAMTAEPLVSDADYVQLSRLIIEHAWRVDNDRADTVHELYVDNGELIEKEPYATAICNEHSSTERFRG